MPHRFKCRAALRCWRRSPRTPRRRPPLESRSLGYHSPGAKVFFSGYRPLSPLPHTWACHTLGCMSNMYSFSGRHIGSQCNAQGTAATEGLLHLLLIVGGVMGWLKRQQRSRRRWLAHEEERKRAQTSAPQECEDNPVRIGAPSECQGCRACWKTPQAQERALTAPPWYNSSGVEGASKHRGQSAGSCYVSSRPSPPGTQEPRPVPTPHASSTGWSAQGQSHA